MALPVLDGNQSATTLSSVVTGGEHIVAHSVVSLGANAIANITSAVSGVPISGTVTANVIAIDNINSVPISLRATDDGFLISSIDYIPPISGTVTVGALPSGSLTTRFGSVTTANTAQITSAVTNANRKYLLAQNISAGTVTIGIGFSPTTTQGIQLTAGGGLTFDAFCPTGAVYWLGAVTGAAFTILEG